MKGSDVIVNLIIEFIRFVDFWISVLNESLTTCSGRHESDTTTLVSSSSVT